MNAFHVLLLLWAPTFTPGLAARRPALIDTIDSDGVALAAIQGLTAVVEEKQAEIDELRSAQEALREELAEVRALLAAPPRFMDAGPSGG